MVEWHVLVTETNNNDIDVYTLPPLDWATFGRVLHQITQKITLDVSMEPTHHPPDELAFARAIHGHPTIQRFETIGSIDFFRFSIPLTALSTLPALESVVLGHEDHFEGRGDGPIIQRPEQLTNLLQSPSLRSVELNKFYRQVQYAKQLSVL
jgi:hypothetical protein